MGTRTHEAALMGSGGHRLNWWGQPHKGLHREWRVAGCERSIGSRQMEPGRLSGTSGTGHKQLEPSTER